MTLSQALTEAQSKVIGIFKPNYDPDSIELVIKEEDHNYLTTIKVGTLLGLSTNHCPAEKGIYIKFLDGKTLSQMMEDPFAFHLWCKQANI